MGARDRILTRTGLCGMARLSQPPVRRRARELRQVGVRLTAPPARGGGSAGLEGLSERREIVRLVAEGRSNKEVAATLFLSAKTIEHHLSRAYASSGCARASSSRRSWRARQKRASPEAPAAGGASRAAGPSLPTSTA